MFFTTTEGKQCRIYTFQCFRNPIWWCLDILRLFFKFSPESEEPFAFVNLIATRNQCSHFLRNYSQTNKQIWKLWLKQDFSFQFHQWIFLSFWPTATLHSIHKTWLGRCDFILCLLFMYCPLRFDLILAYTNCEILNFKKASIHLFTTLNFTLFVFFLTLTYSDSQMYPYICLVKHLRLLRTFNLFHLSVVSPTYQSTIAAYPSQWGWH